MSVYDNRGGVDVMASGSAVRLRASDADYLAAHQSAVQSSLPLAQSQPSIQQQQQQQQQQQLQQLQQQQQQQQVPQVPIQTTVVPQVVLPPGSIGAGHLIKKLSVDLLKTYNTINQVSFARSTLVDVLCHRLMFIVCFSLCSFLAILCQKKKCTTKEQAE